MVWKRRFYSENWKKGSKMSKKSNTIIIVIGSVGGLVLVVTFVVVMVMSTIADFSSPDGGDKKVVFSVSQQSDNVLQDINTLEQAKATYEKGERRLAAEEEEEKRSSLSSTSFASGAFRATTATVKEEAPTVSEQEPAVSKEVVAQPKPNKPKSQSKPKPEPVVEQPVQVEPQAQAPRKKRTSFDESATAQQPAVGAGGVKFRARIFEDVSIIGNSNVRVRVIDEFTYNGCLVRRNTILPAVAQRGSNVVTVQIQNMVACGNRVTVNIQGYSLDGTLGLPVREDEAAEVGVREGGNAAVSGVADAVSSRSAGVLGVVGRAVSSGISSGTRASQQVKPVLLEEGRELLFIGS